MKKNAPLWIGLSIPVLMIVFVAISIYLPKFYHHPSVDFLFSQHAVYYFGNAFKVEGSKVVGNELTYPENYHMRYDPKLSIYDVELNETREISLKEAQKLHLDTRSKSPDGYEVVRGERSDGIFSEMFGNRRGRNFYLKGRGGTTVLKNLDVGSSYYYSQLHFIGWILEKE